VLIGVRLLFAFTPMWIDVLIIVGALILFSGKTLQNWQKRK